MVFGVRRSPPDLVVADAIRLDQVALDGSVIYWTKSQPQKQGRSFVYRVIEGKEPELVTPDDENRFNVRTRVHEYGGGSFFVEHGVVYFSNFTDQRLYRHDVEQQPRPITAPRTGARYADGVIDRQRGRIICVREDHTVPGKVINTMVSIDIAGASEPQILACGNDFYSTPRLSSDGNRLAWLTWNHPNMPWVATEAWVGEIADDGMPEMLAQLRVERMRHYSSPNGLRTAISTSSLTGPRGGGISTASEPVRSNRSAPGKPNLDGRNGLLVCRPTRSKARSG